MTTTIIIRKTFGGFAVIRNKTRGLNKGDTTLATFCGGQLGRILALNCAASADLIVMADAVVFEGPQGRVTGEQAIIDAMAELEDSAQV